MKPISHAADELFEACSGRIYLGFSGGMDSMVLLHAAAAQARHRGALARLAAVHLDHGLAAESGQWAGRCAAEAEALGVEFIGAACQVATGSNLEARARTARYAVFERLLGSGDLLALAHHAADQTESLLLHLLQGRGLYGMPRMRELGSGQLIRPLLAVSRDEIAGYARAHQLRWIEDPGNADPALDRNFLRHEVLPLLVSRFPELPRRLAGLAGSAAASGRALIELAGLDRRPLPLSVLDGFSQPVRLTLLRHWLIHQGAGAGISSVSLAEFLTQLDAANDRQPSLETPAGRLARYRRQLYLVGEPPLLEAEYRLQTPGSLVLPHGVLSLVEQTPCSNSESESESESESGSGPATGVQLQTPARVSFLPALPAGAAILVGGHRRSPRELMRAAGIPPWDRDCQPLVLDDLGVAALPGIAVRDPLVTGASRERGQAVTRRVTMDVRWAPDVD